MSGVDLPTKVLYEIFIRLPSLEPVYKFRCVSKLWNSLLSDSSFINKFFNTISTSSIPWILMHDPSNQKVQLYLDRNHKFINHHDGFSFEFLSDSFKTQEIDGICILDSCSNGLVLYSVFSYHDSQHSRHTKFYICNPLTKQWVSLPPRPYSPQEDYDERTNPQKHYHRCTKLVCESSSASLCQSTCSYKVVHTYSDFNKLGTYNFNLQIFSSDTGEWKTFPWPKEVWGPNIWHDFSDMLIRNGVLYWMAHGPGGKILAAYSTLENTENINDGCRSIAFSTMSDKINVSHGQYCFFGESEGSIYYGYIDPKDCFSMWQLEDDYINEVFNWRMVHKNIQLEGYRSTKLECVYLNPVDRNVIIIIDRGCCISYNVTTLKRKFLRGCPIPKSRNPELAIFITPKPTVIPSLNKANNSVDQMRGTRRI